MTRLCHFDVAGIALTCLSVKRRTGAAPEGEIKMSILILAIMAPLCAFYLYALVNFQKEIRHAKQDKLHGVETITFNVRAAHLSGEVRDTARDTPHDTANDARQPASRAEVAPQQVCSFELIYLGPLPVAPTQEASHWRAPQRAMPTAEKSAR
jgi:hypothetical protein